MMVLENYISNNDITGAINNLTQKIKTYPNDHNAREILAQLYCICGDLQKADSHFNIIAKQLPDKAMMIALYRQIVRALMHRKAVFEQNALPDFIMEADHQIEQHLKLLTVEDQKDRGDILNKLDSTPKKYKVMVNSIQYEMLRDLNDSTAYIFELIATNGSYYWAAQTQVSTIKLSPINTMFDLYLREAEIEFINGKSGTFFMPMTYWHKEKISESMMLGRETEWYTDNQIVLGHGQKMFLANDSVLNFSDISEIQHVG